MSMNEMIERAESSLLHAYNRYPVVFERGEGVYLYDTDGKRYLDAFSGIGVFALGNSDRAWKDALKAQIDKLTHISNYYYSEPLVEAAEKFDEASDMDRVFFTNSGAESVEGALKAARKYAWLKDGRTDHEVIAMDHSFHGRTFGALSLTGTKKYRDPFEPLPGPVHFAQYNDLESVKSFVNDRTCAIIMEPVQGEGGIHPAQQRFIEGVRRICDDNDILLIFDEVQCGMGRSGQMFAYQHYGVKPDIMTSAKALGCGVPVGAFAMTQETADKSLEAGDHGTTLGGNPFVCAAVCAVFDEFERLQIPAHVQELTPYIEAGLDRIRDAHPNIIDRRGLGFMQALEFDGPVAPVIERGRENGIILINAGSNILRIIPPLVYTKDDIDEMCRLIEASI